MKLICTQPHDEERDRLAGEVAKLVARVTELKTERDARAGRNELLDEIEELKRERGTLAEEHAREIRETEHKTGLLKKKTEQDIAHAKRETELKVREDNLAADKERFKAEMDFQRERLQGEVDRIGGVLEKILERLPVIDVALSGGAVPRSSPARSKAGKDED